MKTKMASPRLPSDWCRFFVPEPMDARGTNFVKMVLGMDERVQYNNNIS